MIAIVFGDCVSSQVNIRVGPYGGKSIGTYGGRIDGGVRPAILRETEILVEQQPVGDHVGLIINTFSLILCGTGGRGTCATTKGYVGVSKNLQGYLAQKKPPPTLGPS